MLAATKFKYNINVMYDIRVFGGRRLNDFYSRLRMNVAFVSLVVERLSLAYDE